MHANCAHARLRGPGERANALLASFTMIGYALARKEAHFNPRVATTDQQALADESPISPTGMSTDLTLNAANPSCSSAQNAHSSNIYPYV
jgi:hypothetical protein